MARSTVNRAASIKQGLLNLARDEGRVYDTVLVRYALERLLYRLSISGHCDLFILKGGMLVTTWLDGGNRETRDADFLGFGNADERKLRKAFAEILAIEADDGLVFDIEGIRTTTIREEVEYGGVRLQTTAYLERSRIPVVIDVGFGDAIPGAPSSLSYPSLLDMEKPQIHAYPPTTVIAEKFHAIVALGTANGRMKDYFDLWAIPRALPIADSDLDDAIRATFDRRRTRVPVDRPAGLSPAMTDDPTKQAQWRAYARSIDLASLALDEVVQAVWELVGPSCARIGS